MSSLIADVQGMLTVQLTLDPDASDAEPAAQAIWKMKTLFSFHESLEKSTAELLKDLILQELSASSNAFDTKVR